MPCIDFVHDSRAPAAWGGGEEKSTDGMHDAGAFLDSPAVISSGARKYCIFPAGGVGMRSQTLNAARYIRLLFSFSGAPSLP